MREYFLQPLQLNYDEMTVIEEKLDKNENSSFARGLYWRHALMPF